MFPLSFWRGGGGGGGGGSKGVRCWMRYVGGGRDVCVKVVGCLGGRWDSVGTMVHLVRACIVVPSPPLPEQDRTLNA